MRRAVVPGIVLTVLSSACGASAPPVPPRSAEERGDRCVIALRFVSDEAEDRVAPDASDAAPPTTALSLVRICDESGRLVSSLGEERGVCQYEGQTRGALLSARCWWPGQPGVSLRVVRDGRSVSVLALEESALAEPRVLGTLELPERARVDVLAPGHTRPERE